MWFLTPVNFPAWEQPAAECSATRMNAHSIRRTSQLGKPRGCMVHSKQARAKMTNLSQIGVHHSNYQLYTDFPCCAQWKTFKMYLLRKSLNESTMSADENKRDLDWACQPSSRNQSKCPRLARGKICSSSDSKVGATLSEKPKALKMVS